MSVVELRFRVPEGEEMTDERMEALDEVGLSEEDTFSDEPGELTICWKLSGRLGEEEMEEAVEEVAEAIMDVTGDMEFVEYEISGDA